MRMADNDEHGNGRVTLAVLATKLDALTGLAREIKDCQQGQGADISSLQREDVRLQGEISRVNDRISGWAGVQAAISVVLAAIAGFVGTRQ